jgi:hypothetical protein
LKSVRSVVLTRRTLWPASFVVLIAVAGASVGGCRSKDTPSEPSRTIVDLRITGPNALISESANYTATATYSDDTSSSESATWSSSSTAVAEISSGGQLTALTTGSTTVSASFDGLTATLAVQVTNPLVGQWVLTATTNPGNPSGINTRIKTFTENTFLIQQTAASGAVLFRHGGRYTLRGTAYTETVEFANASTAGLIGQTFMATLNLGANQFTQSAPVAETWTRVQ